MSPDIQAFVREVAAHAPGIASMWLFGSRANGTATLSSDWDLLAFGDEAVLAQLAAAKHLHRNDVDLLVVTGDRRFRGAWGAKEKDGFLESWNWQESSGAEATYLGTKPRGGEDQFNVEVRQLVAQRVWPPDPLPGGEKLES